MVDTREKPSANKYAEMHLEASDVAAHFLYAEGALRAMPSQESDFDAVHEHSSLNKRLPGMSVKSAWIFAAVICGAAALATTVVSGSPLMLVPFIVLFIAAGTIASILGHSEAP
jgi:hypothetical protein